MTDTTKQAITSHSSLDEDELELVRMVERHAEQTRDLVNNVQRHIEARANLPLPEGHAPHSQVTSPGRWAALAQTDLQTGYMKLMRAIAQPPTF